MNIKILDSWLREYLKTSAKPADIAKHLSLSSVSVERLERKAEDYIYDIEVTTNRPDLMSVVGLARETAAALAEQGIEAEFKKNSLENRNQGKDFPVKIEAESNLVNRICAVVMDVAVKDSPKKIKDRLEASGIRSLNNLIDVTNYVMREIGHPVHVFDFDKLNAEKLTIRKSKKGESLVTLDKKQYSLLGGDIVMEDSNGRIVDLLGIMGLENSVVGENTKKILLFLDNTDPTLIRKTSMELGIRSEAAVLNEKGVDPELAMPALLRGIELYKGAADGKVSSSVLDIYPNPPKKHEIKVSLEKISRVIGEAIPEDKCRRILRKLDFEVTDRTDKLLVKVPSFRLLDVKIEEDIIEEIARVYGYQRLPSILPPLNENLKFTRFETAFYWERRVKEALKYFGFTEVYTYSLVSEDLYDGPIENALTLKNPLSSDMTFLRSSLIPSLLEVLGKNKGREEIKIFEIACVYKKRQKDLPEEKLLLSGALKKPNVSFFEAKGILETLFEDLGIKGIKFKKRLDGAGGAEITRGKDYLGYIEPVSADIIDFELDFEKATSFSTLKKVYNPIGKFPPISEDLAVILKPDISTIDVAEEIKTTDPLIVNVSLLDRFEDIRTFHIVFQSTERNITKGDVGKVREKIKKRLIEMFQANFK
ncbi:MAG: Phenylalanine-tRNA ligase beta subunit [Candidatus Levybacteria bacterium GW2011_GWC1_40_19]|nr:MAG: Phenylalanine-tRNA ligase beta subunit [Candidatus Levybacteria bacterium GW2011_GWA1_39_32]KKR50126.1 MAG: Phenylalanine-tRNA ligase beta subunit [Candidatus Levybacteria bacterium GW2011_GWC1_40_19]KKR72964.1 MAG: Phenylalanine-tRNA ligase beta subunit [Candidatus Levybacteria bacterium GW2011_GWC2_40_7]KKR94974.1 MAG: Phenylalanine-tRNA ligase beta subunit [Candidatus Levybacteria bacterium GW2011_GWA2_41_15]OGH21103.1 MAG: phenylalanine--tRNA ligase subunit beta [Candidatus Levybact